MKELPIVSKIPPEWAQPFVLSYANQWGIDSSKVKITPHVTWYGGFLDTTLKAVIGLLKTDGSHVYFEGYYCEDSLSGRRALLALEKALYHLPYDFYSHCVATNYKHHARLKKMGWEQVTQNSKEILFTRKYVYDPDVSEEERAWVSQMQ